MVDEAMELLTGMQAGESDAEGQPCATYGTRFVGGACPCRQRSHPGSVPCGRRSPPFELMTELSGAGLRTCVQSAPMAEASRLRDAIGQREPGLLIAPRDLLEPSVLNLGYSSIPSVLLLRERVRGKQGQGKTV